MIDIVKICSIFRASFTLYKYHFLMSYQRIARQYGENTEYQTPAAYGQRDTRAASPLRAEAQRLAAQANAALRPTLKIR